jgi:hypothetical protein
VIHRSDVLDSYPVGVSSTKTVCGEKLRSISSAIAYLIKHLRDTVRRNRRAPQRQEYIISLEGHNPPPHKPAPEYCRIVAKQNDIKAEIVCRLLSRKMTLIALSPSSDTCAEREIAAIDAARNLDFLNKTKIASSLLLAESTVNDRLRRASS